MYCRVGLLACLLAGCARQPAAPAFDRIAILRFENLSADASADWIGRAFSDIVAAELAGAPGIDSIPAIRIHAFDRVLGARSISAPGISSERVQALAAGARKIGYGQYAFRAGSLEAHLTLEDVRTGKMTKAITASAPASDVLAAATALARQIAGQVSPYGTRSPQALRAYITGTEARDPAAMEVALNLAIAADPDFGAPYRLLAQFRAGRRDRSGALAVLERAEARQSMAPFERAMIAEMAADLRGDLAARERALAAMLKVTPGDAASWRSLGEVANSRHKYGTAVQALRKAVDLEPEDVTVLNLLGYAAAEAGDLEAGMAALRRYQALRPNDANPLDSMGDLNQIAGHLAEAESFYLLAQKKDRNWLGDGDLHKAAVSRLLRGDLAGAGALAQQYQDARTLAKDPLVPVRQAEWAWALGRRQEAYRQLEVFAAGAQSGPLREVSSRAYAELTIWSLVLGDRPAAARTAPQAMALAGPASIGVAVVVQFLAQPPASPAEWVVRAEQRFSDEALAGIKDFALAYSLLLNGHFEPAQRLLKQMYDRGGPAVDEGLPYALAWADVATGRLKEAEPLLRLNPLANASGFGPFASFYLPRIFYLRGAAAEKEGKREQARSQYQLFLKLSGNDPLVWGEEKKAQDAIR